MSEPALDLGLVASEDRAVTILPSELARLSAAGPGQCIRMRIEKAPTARRTLLGVFAKPDAHAAIGPVGQEGLVVDVGALSPPGLGEGEVHAVVVERSPGPPDFTATGFLTHTLLQCHTVCNMVITMACKQVTITVDEELLSWFAQKAAHTGGKLSPTIARAARNWMLWEDAARLAEADQRAGRNTAGHAEADLATQHEAEATEAG